MPLPAVTQYKEKIQLQQGSQCSGKSDILVSYFLNSSQALRAVELGELALH